eukprot:scaffold327042_cov31-Prasinocladus_malaysianus.AAC.1
MDKTARLWHISIDRECLREFKHTDFVTAVRFHPQDDKLFISGSIDGKVSSHPPIGLLYNAPRLISRFAVALHPKQFMTACMRKLPVHPNNFGYLDIT